MRFMVIEKAEAAATPLPDGLVLGPKRTRVAFSAGKATAIESLADAHDAVGRFTMIDAESKQDAIEWVKRLPRNGDAEIEIREGGCPGGVPSISLSKAGRAAGGATRFVVMLKGNPEEEAGRIPDESRLRAMVTKNEASVKSQVLLAGEGLQPSSRGARVKFTGGKTTIMDGPFAEAKELVAGFWLIQARSREEAIEWVKAYPFPYLDAEVEVRETVDAQ